MSALRYELALAFARRRIREGDLPRQAGEDAADYYNLSEAEKVTLIEALPSAGQETTTLTGEEDVEKAPQHDGAFVPGNSRSRPTGREPKGSSSTASVVPFDHAAALTGAATPVGSSGREAARAAATRKDAAIAAPVSVETLGEEGRGRNRPEGAEGEVETLGQVAPDHLTESSRPSSPSVFDHDAALARARADGRDYMRRRA